MPKKKTLAVVCKLHEHFAWFKRANEHLCGQYAFQHVYDHRSYFGKPKPDFYIIYSVMPKQWMQILSALEMDKVQPVDDKTFKL